MYLSKHALSSSLFTSVHTLLVRQSWWTSIHIAKETWARELIKNRWKQTIMSKVRSKSRLDLSSKASRTNGARGISLKHEFGGRKSRWQTPMTTDWWRQHCQCESARHCTLMRPKKVWRDARVTCLTGLWSRNVCLLHSCSLTLRRNSSLLHHV